MFSLSIKEMFSRCAQCFPRPLPERCSKGADEELNNFLRTSAPPVKPRVRHRWRKPSPSWESLPGRGPGRPSENWKPAQGHPAQIPQAAGSCGSAVLEPQEHTWFLCPRAPHANTRPHCPVRGSVPGPPTTLKPPSFSVLPSAELP